MTPRPTVELLDATCVLDEQLKDCPDGKTGPRRFSAVAYTGALVDRAYGKFGIDLAGFQKRDQIPMFLDHDPSKIVGYADKMKVTDRGLELEGVLSSKTEWGRLVADLSDEGLSWQMSVGIDVAERQELSEGEECELNGQKVKGPVSVARKVRLMETSFLCNGADPSTSGVALSRLQATLTEEHNVPETMTQPKRESLKEFLAKFPNDTALAATVYADEGTETDVKLAIAERDSEALKALRAEHETLQAENAALKEQLATLKALETQAGSPGVGFRGAPTQGALLSADGKPDYKAIFAASEKLQREFPSEGAFLAYCRVERPSLKELV